MSTDEDTAARLSREVELHRDALEAFLASAETLPADAWNAPRRGEKWSPAQVSEHLRLTYVTVRSELAGEGGFRIRTKRWQQWIFRLLYLPRILRSGRFPKAVPATREIRPAAGPYDRQQLLAALRDEGERFLEAVRADLPRDRSQVTHPFLGSLSLLDGVRFTAQHVRHHHAQIVPESDRPG